MSLGYLPLALVRFNFKMVDTSKAVRRLKRRWSAIIDAITYFRNNYINGRFIPRMKNVYKSNVDCRTHNHVEGNRTAHDIKSRIPTKFCLFKVVISIFWFLNVMLCFMISLGLKHVEVGSSSKRRHWVSLSVCLSVYVFVLFHRMYSSFNRTDKTVRAGGKMLTSCITRR